MLPWLRDSVVARRPHAGRRRTRRASSTCSPTPGARRSPLAAAGASVDPRRRVAAGGRLGPPQRRAVRARRPRRSAGSSTTPRRSSRARRAAAGATTARPRPAELRPRAGGRRVAARRTDLPSPARGVRRAARAATAFVLLTAHTPGFDGDRLAAELADALRRRPTRRRTRASWRCRPRTAGAATSGRSRDRRRGHDAAMPSPARPVLTSLANPRVKAAAALRDRREREATGLTIVDGAREIRRALDAGVEVVEAFVCEPLLAGPDARAALDRLARPRRARPADQRAVFAKLAFGDRAEGIVASSGSRRSTSPRCRAARRPAGRRPRGRREAGQPRRGPADRRRRGRRRRDRRRSADRPVQPERDPGQPRDDLHACRSRPPRPPTVLAWLARARRCGSSPPRRRRARSTRTADLRGPLAIVLGSEADGLTDAGPAPASRRSGSRCSASPTA